ncbi:MAG: hypothetical protein Q9181_002332 [Wetmoreana brouardii]
MATYGKKKRAIFPAFSVFQDDDQPPKKSHTSSAYTQLGAQEQAVKHTLSHDDASDGDIDELASTTLLDTLDKQSDSASMKNNSLQSKYLHTEGPQHLRQAQSKPLPPLPMKAQPKGLDKEKTKRQVLASKSTNQRVFGKKTKMPSRPKISAPVLISSTTDPSLGTAGAGRIANDPASLDKRIAALTQQADVQEAKTREKEKALAAAEASSRPSSLQRGKSVLAIAKRAITSRLSSPKIKLGRTKITFNRTLSAPEYESLDQHLETDSSPPKHLSVYESMRNRRETPEPKEADDPFSDTMETDEVWSDFEVNFDRYRNKKSSLRKASTSQTPPPNASHDSASGRLLVRSMSPMSYSNEISGLRQHPTTEWFSSSPVGFSTPRVRLEPTSDTTGKKRLSAVLVRDPSLPEFSFEIETTDDEADPLVRDKTSAELSSNMKRKSAAEDPQAQASKRAKTDSAASGETSRLARSLDQLGTDSAGREQDVEMSEESVLMNKGFGIFDLGKGKKPEPRIRDSRESSSIHRHSRQHSSSVSSRPTSVLFSRESRARFPLLEKYEEDEMDVDELQMEDTKMVDESLK